MNDSDLTDAALDLASWSGVAILVKIEASP